MAHFGHSSNAKAAEDIKLVYIANHKVFYVTRQPQMLNEVVTAKIL